MSQHMDIYMKGFATHWILYVAKARKPPFCHVFAQVYLQVICGDNMYFKASWYFQHHTCCWEMNAHQNLGLLLIRNALEGMIFLLEDTLKPITLLTLNFVQ